MMHETCPCASWRGGFFFYTLFSGVRGMYDNEDFLNDDLFWEENDDDE